MIGGRKGVFHHEAHGAPGHAEGAFGSDMNSVRLEFVEPIFNPAPGEQGQLDFRIGRQRHGSKPLAGMNNLPDMAHSLGFFDHALHCAHDAINLRIPGVRNEHDAHERSFNSLSQSRANVAVLVHCVKRPGCVELLSHRVM